MPRLVRTQRKADEVRGVNGGSVNIVITVNYWVLEIISRSLGRGGCEVE